MQKCKNFRCPGCKKVYNSLATWSNHMLQYHKDMIPEGWSTARYFYFLQTGKKEGMCIVCKKPTEWNEQSAKYNRFCNDPKCKQQYREMFKQRMINKHGRVCLLDDPEQQRKMLMAKKTSGEYKFSDGKVPYASTYELDFLRFLDRVMGASAKDIIGPSPHTYYYNYTNPEDRENEGKKFYIPDFWIPSLNLEVEIKQNTSTHPKIIRIDKVKEREKDELMANIPGVNYIKIVDMNYKPFMMLFLKLRNEMPDEVKKEDTPAYESVQSLTTNYPGEEYPYIPLESLDCEDLPPRRTEKFKDKLFSSVRFGLDCKGEVFYDNGKPVAVYQTDRSLKNHNQRWIQAFEVIPEYQHKYLASQMLPRCLERTKATHASCSDLIMQNILLRNGFRTYATKDAIWFMKLEREEGDDD